MQPFICLWVKKRPNTFLVAHLNEWACLPPATVAGGQQQSLDVSRELQTTAAICSQLWTLKLILGADWFDHN